LNNTTKNTNFIKTLAQDMGFTACGISMAKKLENEEDKFSQWLKNGYHGKMKYMENHFDKRLDPTKLVPGAKSVISLLFNYAQPRPQVEPKISVYALGEDYHQVIKDKLFEMVSAIKANIGDIDGRVFVDSAPVMERQWAEKAGLGWLGKHGLLIRKQEGSLFFIAQIISDLALDSDSITSNHCGTCTACIDACPTNAIVLDGVVDSTKCISYLTIELHDNIPLDLRPQLNGWAYGCDICQDVCPWNKFSSKTNESRFLESPIEGWTSEDWIEITENIFKKTFGKSAIKRIGFEKLKQNITHALGT
jgi:epoxyqueuosine reductase